ncbi:MAG: HYR domain-containing protein [Phycisphaerales bacterium]|nr:HYR domain-containing protein [Phycisphaerales bacterium]
MIQLSGACSTDPSNGAPLALYEWSSDCLEAVISDPNSPTPTITISRSGDCEQTCNVSLRVVREGTGDETTATTTITIRDTTAPILTGVTDLTIECGGSTNPAVTGIPSPSDNCGAPGAPTFSDDTSTPGIIVRTWSAFDECENQGVLVQTLTLAESFPPLIFGVTDVTVECGSPTDPGATGFGIGVDECEGPLPTTFADVVLPGRIERTWSATDSLGITGSLTQIITINDTTPPTLTLPPDTTVPCGGDTSPEFTGQATATDVCDEIVEPTFTDAPGPEGELLRNWVARDRAGNEATGTQIITFSDAEAPILTVPADAVVECGGDSSPAATGTATATDNCDGDLTPTFADATGKAGELLRTWTARDAAGNEATGTQVITFADTTPPDMTVPPSAVVECGGDSSPAATGSATAEDVCDGPLTPTFTDAPQPDGSLVRSWIALDAAGNEKRGEQSITFADTTPPVIACPAAVRIETSESSVIGASVTLVATATDTCTTATVSDDRPAAFATGTTTVTFTATDEDGNSSTCTATVEIVTVGAGNQNSNDNSGGGNGNDNGTGNANDNSGGRPQPGNDNSSTNDNQSGQDLPDIYHEEELIITTIRGWPCGPLGLTSLSLGLLSMGVLRLGRGSMIR